jgi:hypothetical protein
LNFEAVTPTPDVGKEAPKKRTKKELNQLIAEEEKNLKRRRSPRLVEAEEGKKRQGVGFRHNVEVVVNTETEETEETQTSPKSSGKFSDGFYLGIGVNVDTCDNAEEVEKIDEEIEVIEDVIAEGEKEKTVVKEVDTGAGGEESGGEQMLQSQFNDVDQIVNTIFQSTEIPNA